LFGHERGAFTGAVRQNIGKIESANGGTLFLDEIGDIPMAMQVKLLRFLEDQVIERVGGRQRIKINVRILCATNKNLAELIAAGTFREDLFYRINEISLNVPALREREGDIVVLANHFLRKYGKEFGRTFRRFSSDAVEAMLAYSWRGIAQSAGSAQGCGAQCRRPRSCASRREYFKSGGAVGHQPADALQPHRRTRHCRTARARPSAGAGKGTK